MDGAVDGLLAQALTAKIINPATVVIRQARNSLRIFPPLIVVAFEDKEFWHGLILLVILSFSYA
jgi:hypothetical protein